MFNREAIIRFQTIIDKIDDIEAIIARHGAITRALGDFEEKISFDIFNHMPEQTRVIGGSNHFKFPVMWLSRININSIISIFYKYNTSVVKINIIFLIDK